MNHEQALTELKDFFQAQILDTECGSDEHDAALLSYFAVRRFEFTGEASPGFKLDVLEAAEATGSTLIVELLFDL